MPINIIGIITLFIVFLNIVLGIFVLIKNHKNANNIVYAIIALSISVWALLTYFYNNPGVLSPVFWLKMVYLASYFMLIAQMTFAYYFPRKVKSNFYLYAIPILISLIPSTYVLMFKESVILSATHYPERFISVAEMGSGYWIYIIPNTLGIFLLAIYFLKKSKLVIGYEKAQVHFYVLGALLMMVPLVILDYGIPILTGDTQYFVYGPLFAIPFSIALAYSILKSRFFTIKMILEKSIYSTLIFIYLILCSTIFINLFERGYLNFPNRMIGIGVFCLIAGVIFIFILHPLIKSVLKFFFKGGIPEEEILNNFSQVSNVELTVDRIVIHVKRTIQKIFSIDKVGMILFDKNNYNVKYQYITDFENLQIEELLLALRHWADISMEKVFIYDEIKRKSILEGKESENKYTSIMDTIEKIGISLTMPFSSRTQFDGVLLLGYRRDKYPLSVNEVNLLQKIVSNISVSIGRAILYQEVQDFSNSLKEKVNEQTKELQTKVIELQEARRKEADMIDIMGHELRTPATVVKLNVELLQKYIKENPQEFGKYVDRIKQAVETEIGLINTLLTSAKLEGNKVEIRHERVNVKDEIEMSIHGHERDIKGDISVYTNVDSNLPEAYADRIRVAEVLNNLISNAIKYTDKGSITISATSGDNNIIVSIKDTGKGISKEDLSKLGNKFYRVDNYLDSNIVRPGGTGLGLYITFGLVRLMGGTINVQSEVGKGSTFTFTLPKYNGQQVDRQDTLDRFAKLGLK
ncbi:hypothetical protein KBB42_00285 [Candidatus Dojkabacteria bacterium]|nr:hypothetical protein [Candidatus Dojkabacteria bacterium]